MKRRIIMALLLAAVTAGGAGGAWAHDADGRGPGMAEEERCGGKGGASHERGPARMAEALGLSDAQKTKVRALFKAEREKSDELMEKLAAYGKELRQAERAARFDEAAVRATALKRAQVEVELAVSRARLHSEVNAVLTPEQRARAEKLRPPMEECGPGHRHPMGGRWPGHRPPPPCDDEE